jgi:hypothetical protein
MPGDTSEHIGEPGLWIHVVQARRLDERVEHRRALTVVIESAEQPRLPATQRKAWLAASFVMHTRQEAGGRIQHRSM